MKTRILSGIAAFALASTVVRRRCAMPATRSASSARRPCIPSPPPLPSSSARPAPSRPRSSNRPARAAASSSSAPASAKISRTSPTPRAPSRRASSRTCDKNGVAEIVELKIGFDGIDHRQFVKAGPDLKLTKTQIFLALAKEVPGPDGKLAANPYKTWNDIDPSLPAEKIEVLGPPPTSGTRDAFLELVMDQGARKIESLAALRRRTPRPSRRSGSRSARTAPISTPARTTT